MEKHYSWIIVTITAFSIALVGTLITSGMLFLSPFGVTFHQDENTISFALGLSLLICGFSSPFFATSIEKAGLKKVMLISISILIIGIFLALFVYQLWQIVLIWGIVFGVGASLFLSTIIPYVANNWFKENYGIVIGILTSSIIVGKIILFPVLAWIIENLSWELAVAFLLLLFIILFFIVYIFMKNPSENINMLSFDQKEEKKSTMNTFSFAFKGLFEAFKTKEFWLLNIAFFSVGLAYSGLIEDIVFYSDINSNASLVSIVLLSVFAIVFNIIATIFSGWLSDKYDSRLVIFFYFALLGCSFIFVSISITFKISLLILFTLFTGLYGLIIVPPAINIVRQKFGILKTPSFSDGCLYFII